MPMPRRHPSLALLAGATLISVGFLAGAARAQSPSVQAPPALPAATAQPAPPATAHHARRTTLAEHFAAANTTHDGHLTLDQARAGMPMAARHFAAMDKANKGYVTLADIHAYLKAQRAARHQGPSGAPVSG